MPQRTVEQHVSELKMDRALMEVSKIGIGYEALRILESIIDPQITDQGLAEAHIKARKLLQIWHLNAEQAMLADGQSCILTVGENRFKLFSVAEFIAVPAICEAMNDDPQSDFHGISLTPDGSSHALVATRKSRDGNAQEWKMTIGHLDCVPNWLTRLVKPKDP